MLKSQIKLKNFLSRNWILQQETSIYSLWSRDQDWNKRKVEIIDFQTICFSIDSGLEIDYRFRFMQMNPGYNKPIFNFILNNFYKSGLTLTIYYKYSKSFIETIPLPVAYGLKILWDTFLNFSFILVLCVH